VWGSCASQIHYYVSLKPFILPTLGLGSCFRLIFSNKFNCSDRIGLYLHRQSRLQNWVYKLCSTPKYPIYPKSSHLAGFVLQQHGAEAARGAHNPEVTGSRPVAAINHHLKLSTEQPRTCETRHCVRDGQIPSAVEVIGWTCLKFTSRYIIHFIVYYPKL
jgi:hypothetical protein